MIRANKLSMLDHLRKIGFNRISMGIQDFNKDVQAQTTEFIQDEEFIFWYEKVPTGFNFLTLISI